MKNKNGLNDYKKWYLLIVVIILFVILVTIFNKKDSDVNIGNDYIKTQQEIEEEKNNNFKVSLQNMKERDRMEYYFSIFIDYVENEDYENAYMLLYDEFKQNYFPTIESFKEYIPTIFSEMTNIKHKNIERSGDLYILWIDVSDAINGKTNEEKEMNVVIKEYDYNDFVLSFSVI